jgi:hypothetical protein
MTSDYELIKSALELAKPLVKPILETWLVPLLTHLRRDRIVPYDVVVKRLSEYLDRTVDKHSYINVLAFQNQQKRLVDLYGPLKVRGAGTRGVIVMDGYRDEFIPACRRVLITDTAGMGKSTILRYLFLSCVESNKGIPIFVDLRRLSKDLTLLDYIFSELNPISRELDREFILELIEQGSFILFLDGYDEISFDQSKPVTRDIQDFVSKARRNDFVMTSRPHPSLAAFPEFQEFKIEPLELSEAFTLLRKYDSAGVRSTELISKIQGNTLDNLREFLTNPFLVSLLFKAYEHKPTIPFKKHLFFRQVYDSLFDAHDLTKEGYFIREKYSQLDSDDFHRVLRYLGFKSLIIGKTEFEKDGLLQILDEARLKNPGCKFTVADFLRDLVLTVPLFNHEGNYYRWAHKSIQEYFAAQFVYSDSPNKKEKIVRAMCQSKNIERYIDVLDLYYDIDYSTFRNVIMYDVISRFLSFYESSYTFIDKNRINDADIHLRKQLVFDLVYMFVPEAGFYCLPINSDLWAFPALREIATRRWKSWTSKQHCADEELPHFYLIHHAPCVAVFPSTILYILRLLRSKKEAIVLLRGGPGGDRIEWEFRECFIVDDDPESPGNQPQWFQLVNDALSLGWRPLLDIEQCRLLKEEIEKDRAYAETRDLLPD